MVRRPRVGVVVVAARGGDILVRCWSVGLPGIQSRRRPLAKAFFSLVTSAGRNARAYPW